MSVEKYPKGISVRVGKGVIDQEYNDLNMEGWQGRVCEILEDADAPEGEELLYCVEWDSQTLTQIEAQVPEYYKDAFKDELDPFRFNFHEKDIEPAIERDTVEQTLHAQAKIENTYFWSTMGEAGVKVAQILNSFQLNKPDDIDELFSAWYKYLETHLRFPFTAVYHTDDEYTAPLPDQALVNVVRLLEIDKIFGTIVETEYKNKKQIVPILYLEAQEGDSKNYEHLELYKLWLSNIYEDAEDDEIYEAWEEIIDGDESIDDYVSSNGKH